MIFLGERRKCGIALIWWCTAGEFYFGSAHQAFLKSLELCAVSHHRTLTLFAALQSSALGYFWAPLGYFLGPLGYFLGPLGYFWTQGLTLFRPSLTLFEVALLLFPADGIPYLQTVAEKHNLHTRIAVLYLYCCIKKSTRLGVLCMDTCFVMRWRFGEWSCLLRV